MKIQVSDMSKKHIYVWVLNCIHTLCNLFHLSGLGMWIVGLALKQSGDDLGWDLEAVSTRACPPRMKTALKFRPCYCLLIGPDPKSVALDMSVSVTCPHGPLHPFCRLFYPGYYQWFSSSLLSQLLWDYMPFQWGPCLPCLAVTHIPGSHPSWSCPLSCLPGTM